MSAWFFKLFNFALYYGAWVVAVYGAASGYFWLGPTVMVIVFCIHMMSSSVKKSDLLMALACLTVGLLSESLWSSLGLVTYAGYDSRWLIAPAWVIALWLNFSITINHSLAWLKGRYVLAGILAAILAPLAYAGGIKIGAAQTDSFALFLAAETLVWSMFVPSIFFCAVTLK